MKIIIFIIALFLNSLSFAQEEVVEVRGAPAKLMSFYEPYLATGILTKTDSISYNAIKPGIVDFINPATKVKKGDLIIAINKEEVEKSLQAAATNLQIAKNSFNRDEALRGKGVISQEAFEKAKSNFKNAEAAYAGSLREYNNSVIFAPFDGDVQMIDLKANDSVQAGQFITKVIPITDKFETIVYVPEKFFYAINDSTPIYQTGGKKLIKIISKSGAVNKETGNFEVKLGLEGDFVENSYQRFIFKMGEHKALSVPEISIIQEGDHKHIYVYRDGKVVKESIITGLRIDDRTEIISGNIREHDVIINEGLTKISDNMKVHLID